tara:strand:+ start:199 stop:435 length:237 start_codon:yes stop_codon:yes gene_type:complete
MKEEENFFNKFKSPTPMHLTPEELKEWEEQMEWDKQEYERRKREGYYPDGESKGIVSKIIKKFKYKAKKWDDPANYGP